MNEPKCPYCGETMDFDADSVHIWMKCNNCLASSPKLYRPDWRNPEFPFASWSDFWEKCKEIAARKAMCRPLQKPLTLQEVLDVDDCVLSSWWEVKRYPEPYSYVECNPAEVYGGLIDGYDSEKANPRTHVREAGDDWCFPVDEYNKTWRCWATKPTDEEREAAPWEE